MKQPNKIINSPGNWEATDKTHFCRGNNIFVRALLSGKNYFCRAYNILVGGTTFFVGQNSCKVPRAAPLEEVRFFLPFPVDVRKLLIAPSPLMLLHVLWCGLRNVAKCTQHFQASEELHLHNCFLASVWQATRLLHTFKRPPKHLIPTQPILLAKLVAKKLCSKTQGSSIVWRHYAIPCVQHNTTVWEHFGDIRSPFRW